MVVATGVQSRLLRGRLSLVSEQLGPRKTRFSIVTYCHTATPFLIVTSSPTTAPDSTNAWSPMLQEWPTTAPFITWA